ncbi:MAG TPA: HK97 family phage prohead protease [Anaerolineae bacterium]|nr:HK97 family phage prohead protease [Anaerolineae bacterium]
MEIERKSFPFELEEKGLDPEARTIKGYAAITGNVDDWGDIIDRGAFKKTLQEQGSRVKVYYIHDFWEPIGKPLEMKEVPRKQLPTRIQEAFPDATGGLFVHFYISETSRGNDALTLARDGVLDEMSIGFRSIKDDEEERDDGSLVRHLKEISLLDVSLVPLAANAGALVTDVKLAEIAQELQKRMGSMGRDVALEKLAGLLAAEEKVEETEDYIEIPVQDAGDFVDDSFRTITLSEDEGIQEVIGKLKSDPDGPTHVQKYRFDKEKGWTMAKAKAWVEEHEEDDKALAAEVPPAEDTGDAVKALARAKLQEALMRGEELEARMR